MRLPALFLISLFSLLFVACSEPETEDQALTDYPNSELLVEADALNDALETEEIILIDAREETSDSLIAGAVHFPAIENLTDPDHPVESYLIGPETFEEKMRDIGLSNEDRVVIYDEGNGLAAARLFYALDYYGFSNASILNGGFSGWIAESLPVTDTPGNQMEGTFLAETQDSKFCDLSYVQEASEDPNKIIFDVRSEDEYAGTDERAEQSGHIPNAVHLEWNNVLTDGDVPYFKPAEEIQEIYDNLGITRDKEVIPHCHTNVRGSHAYFTLRLMGYDSVRAYEGSWAEYGNSSNAVVEQ